MCEVNSEQVERITRSRLQFLSTEEKKIYFTKLENKRTNKKRTVIELSAACSNSESNSKMVSRTPPRKDDLVDTDKQTEDEYAIDQELRGEWQRLEQARSKMEADRIAFDKEKAQLKIQWEKLQRRSGIGEATPGQVDESASWSGLVRQLQSVNVEVKTPIFNENKNPLYFISEIEKYFKLKGINAINHMLALETFLDGRVGDWFFINRNNIVDFEDFKNKFKKEFYPIPIQYQFRQQWASKRYSSNNGSMLSYFYSQYREVIMLEPESSAYDIIFRITAVSQWNQKFLSSY